MDCYSRSVGAHLVWDHRLHYSLFTVVIVVIDCQMTAIYETVYN